MRHRYRMTEPAASYSARHDADPALDRDPSPADESAWHPIDLDEERRYRRQLAEEVRPLVEACRRLRDRGLLD